MKRISGLIVALGLTLPAAAYGAGTEYEDVIHLKDGSVYRGTIVDEVPGEIYRIELYGGSVFVFEAEEIDYISRGITEEAAAPAGPGEETPVETRRLFFSFRGLVGSIYIADEALIPFGGLFLLGWRAHAVYTPALAVGYIRTEPKDADHGSVLAHSFVPIHIHNRFAYYRGRSMKIYGEFDVGYGLIYSGYEPGQNGGFLYGFGQGLELGSGRTRLDLSAVLYVQHYDFGHWGAEPKLLFLGGVGFSM